MPHCSTPRSWTLTPGRVTSSRRSSVVKGFDPCFDRVDAHPHRVPGGDAEADLADVNCSQFNSARPARS